MNHAAMKLEGERRDHPAATEQGSGPRRILILIPAHGSADKLEVCLRSITEHAPAFCTVYVLDDATPDRSVRVSCEEAQSRDSRLHYIRSDLNRGFVRTCNWGREELLSSGSDLLLLNSDAELTAGCIEELQAVLNLHEKNAVATPRSNNATIFSVPWNGERMEAAESYELWQKISPLLPRYQVAPTAVGFCMLIKAEVLERFDLFDEAYSPGYNEENDFVRRINRYGYSAIMANRAFAFHYESSSFGPQRTNLEAAHRAILLGRYPEYARKVDEYSNFEVDAVDLFARLYASHRPRLLFDLFHLESKHSGTSEFGLNLLRELRPLVEGEYDLFVGIGESLPFYEQELRGYRLYRDEPDEQNIFDLLYKPCQIFTWIDFARMARLAPRVTYTLQDIIGVRCEYLSGANRQILFRKTAELADCVFAISEFSRADFNAFYGTELTMRVVHHGTNSGATPGEFRAGDYVLVMGNSFAHKGVKDALRRLPQELETVVLGVDKATIPGRRNLRVMKSGHLSRQQMRDALVNARVVVYPSHYEGYGLPVMDALALGKPVVVLESEVNRELSGVVRDRNLHAIRSLSELEATVRRLMASQAEVSNGSPRRWRAAAEEYAVALRESMAQEIDGAKLRARVETVRLVRSVGG